jgi:hypothetical protein
MKYCSSCGWGNPDNFNSCQRCGAALYQKVTFPLAFFPFICPRCGKPVPTFYGARFCHHCGSRL